MARNTIQRHFLPAVPPAANLFPRFAHAVIGVHDGRPSRPRCPIWPFTMVRSSRSRWSEIRIFLGRRLGQGGRYALAAEGFLGR